MFNPINVENSTAAVNTPIPLTAFHTVTCAPVAERTHLGVPACCTEACPVFHLVRSGLSLDY